MDCSAVYSGLRLGINYRYRHLAGVDLAPAHPFWPPLTCRAGHDASGQVRILEMGDDININTGFFLTGAKLPK